MHAFFYFYNFGFTKNYLHFHSDIDVEMRDFAITSLSLHSESPIAHKTTMLRVQHNTISGIVKEVAEAILAEYEEETFDFPTTPDRWRQVSHIFLPNNVFACVIGLSYSPLHQ